MISQTHLRLGAERCCHLAPVRSAHPFRSYIHVTSSPSALQRTEPQQQRNSNGLHCLHPRDSSTTRAHTEAPPASSSSNSSSGSSGYSRATASMSFLGTAAAATASSLLLLLLAPSLPAAQAMLPPDNSDPDRCALSAFDKFASTRAKFSMEASSGGMAEALVDVRDCSFKGANLDGKVLSGVLMQGADCEGCSIKRAEISRADLRGAVLKDVVFEDSNMYGSQLGGADLRGATFENAILSSTGFGKDEAGNWAQLSGAHFEGALLSSSDVERLCENPTLDLDVRKFELGCRSSK